MRQIFLLLMIITAVILDVSLLGSLKAGLVAPSLSLIMLIYFIFYRGLAGSLMLVFVGGTLLDSFSAVFGFHLLIFFAIAWVVTLIVKHEGEPRMLMLIITTVAVSLLFYSLELLLATPGAHFTSSPLQFAAAIAAGTLVNCLMLVLIFPLAAKAFELISYYETTIKLPGKTV